MMRALLEERIGHLKARQGCEVSDDVRFEVARYLLQNTQVSLAQIAAWGYAEASAFTRAFRRWSGETPTAWRGDSRSR